MNRPIWPIYSPPKGHQQTIVKKTLLSKIIQGWEPLTSDERLKVIIIDLRFLDPTEIMPTVEKQPDSTNCALVKVEEHEHSLAARVEGWRQAHQLLVLSRNSLLEISSSWYSEPDVSASEVLCFAWELWRPPAAKNITGNSYTLLPLLWTLWDVDVFVCLQFCQAFQMALRGFDIVKACRDWQTIHLKSDQLPVTGEIWRVVRQASPTPQLGLALGNPAQSCCNFRAELSTAVPSTKAEGRRHCWRSLGVSSSNGAQAIKIGSGCNQNWWCCGGCDGLHSESWVFRFCVTSKGIIWYCMLYKLYSVRPLLLFEAFVEPSIGLRWPGTKCEPKRSQMPFHAHCWVQTGWPFPA